MVLFLEEKEKLIHYKTETFTLKYCENCKIFRSLRAHHCKNCDLCVEEYDHHSQIISNCVGKRNRKSFFFLLCFSILTVLEIFLLSLYSLLDDRSKNVKTRVLYSLIFLALTSFLFFSIGMMLCLQIYLITNGLNTEEYFKGGFKNDTNPFNEGGLRNWWNFMKRKRSHKNVNLDYFKRKDGRKNLDSNEINLQVFTSEK